MDDQTTPTKNLMTKQAVGVCHFIGKIKVELHEIQMVHFIFGDGEIERKRLCRRKKQVNLCRY